MLRCGAPFIPKRELSMCESALLGETELARGEIAALREAKPEEVEPRFEAAVLVASAVGLCGGAMLELPRALPKD
jgi:hypothetical protein